MARGQAQAADTQLNTTNTVAAQQQQQQQDLQNKLLPQYQSLMDNPLSDEQKKAESGYTDLLGSYGTLAGTGYLSPEEAGAATTSEMGAATAPFGSAQFEAANRAARTNNASDLTAQQDQLALEEGQTAGTAAANLQAQKMANEQAGLAGESATTGKINDIGQQSIQNQLSAMYGIGGLQQGDQSQATSMYGLGPSTLNGRAAGSYGGLFGTGIGLGFNASKSS